VVRPVKVLQPQGAEVAVSGLEAGETVVLEGKQNLRPGSAVVERAKDSKDGPQGAASAAAPGASMPSATGNTAAGGSAPFGSADPASKPKAAP
jgi:hypothetical protein